MTPVETILLARRHGVRLSVTGGKLKIESEEAPPGELMAALREHKDALLQMLVPVAPRPPRCRACGRPQHEPDVVCGPDLCPSWQDPDPRYPIAPPYVPLP